MRFFSLYLCLLTFVANSACMSTKFEEVEESVISVKKSFGISAVESLKKLTKEFDSLQDSENEWEKIASKKGLQKRAQQSWKEAIGAKLFFPEELIGASDSIYTQYLSQRNDIIWSLAIAAKYKDPVGEYYLSRSLSNLYWEYDPYTAIPDPIKNIYFHSMKELETSQNSEDVYIRAYEYSFGDLCFNLSNRNLEKAEELYTSILNSEIVNTSIKARAEFDLLEMKRIYSYKFAKYKDKPYEKIGEKYGFGKAYWRAGILEEKLEKKKDLLEKAVSAQHKFYPAYIDLGLLSKDREDAEKYFNLAYQNNIFAGKINLSKFILSTNIINKNSINNLKKLSKAEEEFKNTINVVNKNLIDAGDKGHPSGYAYLADLYNALYSIERKNDYLKKIEVAVKKGLKLSSLKAYKQLNYLKKEKQEKLITKYGKAPQETLYKDIEEFLSNRNEN